MGEGKREMSQNKSLQKANASGYGTCVRRIYHTRFGGGFTRSAMIYQYLYQLRYLVSDPAGSDTGIVCTVFLGMKCATHKHKTDMITGSFSDSLYGKQNQVMSNLYEIR